MKDLIYNEETAISIAIELVRHNEECRILREHETFEERQEARSRWLGIRGCPHSWRPLALNIAKNLRAARKSLGRRKVRSIRLATRAVGVYSFKHGRVLY